ncbi:60S ribosomal protein L3 [Lophium mytilinum]|uniref:Large ribosomal subunit protein mL44 n=1 Tax=Lophium mytilinum TaxID=390894 RepID=A0A6A6RHZ5_9PEZI|nr:60S ribosomal protein L3 [Lophium mytilinum]
MKRIRIQRWGSQFLAPRTQFRPQCPLRPPQHHLSPFPQPHSCRSQSTSAGDIFPPLDADESAGLSQQDEDVSIPPEALPSPPPSAALKSAKLAALHARLSLPPRLPIQTLARALVHESADPDPNFNNTSLAILGSNLLGLYTSEYLLCHYPRLPISVLFAAQSAYVGTKALALMAHEWGIESVAEPGGEVDPGLLQYRRLAAGAAWGEFAPRGTGRPNEQKGWRRGITSKIVYDDQFGDMRMKTPEPSQPVPLDIAAESFVRALMGATYLHCGRATTKRLFASHWLSRTLDLSKMFEFRTPTVDLSKLCAREGFEPAVARLISETGRASRHPVFVVGVYSGKDKLGEGAGGSIDEARVRAAVMALKSWYLYKPLDVTLPSDAEGMEPTKWKPNLVDLGEVIV